VRTVDLFSGCGGLSLGFSRAGFEVVAAYDSWERALECYRANLPHPVFLMDLSRVEEAVEHIRRFRPEVVIGGPPAKTSPTRVLAKRARGPTSPSDTPKSWPIYGPWPS